MARAPTRSQARLFAQLIAEHEPEIRRAFMASVTDLTAQVNWRELLSALEAGNIEGAIAALNISEAAWAQYSASVSSAYAASGSAHAAQIQALGVASIGSRFNMANPRAEGWIRREVGESVVGFTREQREVARMVIAEGYARGEHPHTIATDLAGRVQGGRRQGGVMGLDRPRAKRLNTVTVGMRTAEGVQDLVVQHRDGSLSLRYKVNKATAQRILKAHRDGTAVPRDQRIISERQYYNALLMDRSQTVAETETGNAVMGSRDEAWHQAAEREGFDTGDVIKRWEHRRGSSRYHRPDHLAMSGTEVRGLDTPFIFPDGAALQYAHDPSGGAKHVIRCGCDTTYRLSREVE